jgi:hypothetical protein
MVSLFLKRCNGWPERHLMRIIHVRAVCMYTDTHRAMALIVCLASLWDMIDIFESSCCAAFDYLPIIIEGRFSPIGFYYRRLSCNPILPEIKNMSCHVMTRPQTTTTAVTLLSLCFSSPSASALAQKERGSTPGQRLVASSSSSSSSTGKKVCRSGSRRGHCVPGTN